MNSDAVWGLAYNGQAAQTCAIIEKLSPEQRFTILATPGAMTGLAVNGQKEGVERIRRSANSWRTRAAMDNRPTNLER